MTELCPRCQENSYTPMGAEGVTRQELKAHPKPALSRVEEVYICDTCGVEEALQDWQGLPLTPPTDWPIRRPPR